MGRLFRNIVLASWLQFNLISSAPTSYSSTVSTTDPIIVPTPSFNKVSSHKSGGEEHIVIIKKTAPVPPRVAEVLKRLDLNEGHPDVRHIFNNSAFQGFAASMQSHCLDLLGNMSDIHTVEKATQIQRADVLRPNAPWGLQRISTTSTVGGSPTALDYTYSYQSSALGSGADIYIVDTGIYTQHNIFGGRAEMLWSFDGDMNDNDGHGTHVSGTAAGNILGVASSANIFGVKALDNDGGGWSSNVVAAINYVIQTHDQRKSQGDNFIGSVMSMSLASSTSVSAINTAIEAAISHGIHTCIAAGNTNQDACDISPASAGGSHGLALTVGAVDITSNRASFSNYGDCVDVYGPGVDVISSWIGQPNMVNILSGTSMATPHVTGIVAYAMSTNQTLADNPALMKDYIRTNALLMSNGILLAYNGVTQAISERELLGSKKVRDLVDQGTRIQAASEWNRGARELSAKRGCESERVAEAALCTARRGLEYLTRMTKLR